jgi:hypothetical protein
MARLLFISGPLCNAVKCGVVAEATLNLNSVNQLIFVMVKCGVLFEVRTEFLNDI